MWFSPCPVFPPLLCVLDLLSVHALGHGVQTSLCHSLFYCFFCVLFEHKHGSPVSGENIWTLRNFCVSADFYFFFFFFPSPVLSFPPYFALPSPLSRNQLNPSIPHSDSSAVLKEEQRSEGCGWAEWWIEGLEKAGVGTSPEFTHLLPAPCHRDIVHLMVDKHNWSWKSPTCSVSPLSSCLGFTE